MDDEVIYHERLSSRGTTTLFLALGLVSFFLLLWRLKITGPDILAMVFGLFFMLFCFYTVNYRVLDIRLTARTLKLSFGVFTWRVPLGNIDGCSPDEIPPFYRYGGAGIHFMTIRHRYRASFNFLEYPRVVIAFKRKAGPVRDLSFSTRQPEEVLRIIQRERSTRRS